MIQKTIHAHTILAWSELEEVPGCNKEDEAFVREKNIHHPMKQKQFYAGRRLLRSFVGADAVIKYDQYGGPIVANKRNAEVSLSHSANMVACAYSDIAIGIDIQQADEKFERVKFRFMSSDELSESEKTDCPDYVQFCWSAKEAMFKAFRKGNINFRQQLMPNIPLDELDLDEFESTGHLIIGNKLIAMRLNYYKHDSYTIVSASFDASKY